MTTPTPEAARALLAEIDNIRKYGHLSHTLAQCRPFLSAYADLHEKLRLAREECEAAKKLIHSDGEPFVMVHQFVCNEYAAASAANPLPEDKPDA